LLASGCSRCVAAAQCRDGANLKRQRRRTMCCHTIHWTASMSATPPAPPPLPDRLSVDPASPFHMPAVFEHPIGIRLDGRERFDVQEYCVSESWVKVPAGRALDRKGSPMLIKLKGKVEAFYKS
jgi:hypothetical protein